MLLLCAPYALRTIELRVAGRDIWKYALSSIAVIPTHYVLVLIPMNMIIRIVFIICVSAVLYFVLIGKLTGRNAFAMIKKVSRH